MNRKLTPNEIKLRGNPSHLPKTEIEKRKRSLAIVPGTKVSADEIVAPDDLDETGTKKYRELIASKTFEATEQAELYALLYSQKAAADRDIAEHGMTIAGERGTKANPSVRLSSELSRELVKLLNQRNKNIPSSNPGMMLIEETLKKIRSAKR